MLLHQLFQPLGDRGGGQLAQSRNIVSFPQACVDNPPGGGTITYPI
jgi:hypothetical protein